MIIRRRRIREQWESYEAAVIPDIAGTVQRREMRKSFYAGASALFGVMLRDVSDSPEHTPEDDALGDDLQAEFDEFLADVKAGRA